MRSPTYSSKLFFTDFDNLFTPITKSGYSNLNSTTVKIQPTSLTPQKQHITPRSSNLCDKYLKLIPQFTHTLIHKKQSQEKKPHKKQVFFLHYLNRKFFSNSIYFFIPSSISRT